MTALEAEARRPLLPEVERRTASFTEAELRKTGDTLTFEGLAAVFDSRSEDLGGFTETIKRGAFRPVLKQPALDVRFLINHEGLPLARSTVKDGPGSLHLEEQTKGLGVVAEFVPTSVARDLDMLIESRVVDQMSFGFTLQGEGQDNWNDDYTERQITRFGDLYDVSVVTFPAYPQTTGTMRSLVAGIEIVDADGEIQDDILEALAKRIHRGSIHVSDDERGRIDAAFARTDRLSPWMEELARRTLGVGSAEQAPPGDANGDNGNAREPDRPRPVAVNARLLTMRLAKRGVK